MAPSKKAQRYAPEPTKKSQPSKPLFDPEPIDAEAGALQPSNSTVEPDWEGFDGDDGEEQEESSEEESSDEESSDDESVKVTTNKNEKPILPKDSEEEELERLIFGDSMGFKEGIDSFSLAPGTALGEESEEEQGDGEDFGDVADQDLFFFDTGPTAQPAGSLAVTKQEDTDDDDDKPAWDDSDDERLVVSLASVPQLRKLRDTEDDDMVNGKEYVRRLRRQYERLYPVPDWAIHASGKTKRKRRHIEDDESDAESASDMDVDDDDLSTLPLARLLQDADILSRTSKNSTKRRKLQAGTVEIARLKDVTGAGPVSDLFPLRIVFTDLIVTGCYNFLVVPSHVPAPSVLWPQLNALASPRERLRPP